MSSVPDIVVTERRGSRSLSGGESARASRRYFITGTADEAEVYAALAGEAPTTMDGQPRRSIEVEEYSVDESDPDACVWEGTVHYSWETGGATPETGDSSFNFEIAAGTFHIVHDLATVGSYYPPGGPTPPCNNMIGATKNGVAGVDITVPTYTWSEPFYLDADKVDGEYKAIIFGLVGTTNQAAFRGFAIGEVLFMGASGSRRGIQDDDDWEVTFRFAASPNKTGLTVGSITGIAKGGWECLDVHTCEKYDSGRCVIYPDAVYIHRVYEPGDFSDLGIG